MEESIRLHPANETGASQESLAGTQPLIRHPQKWLLPEYSVQVVKVFQVVDVIDVNDLIGAWCIKQ